MEYPYKLSIITINLNNKEGLLKTIESVINQTFRDFEWIIIDGGSSDGSKEIIEKYSDQINYWVSEPDKGIYNAMNKGILVSKGEYILFLNSGDQLYNKHVLYKAIKKLNGYDMYLGNFIIDNHQYIYINNYESLIFTLLSNGFLHQSIFYNHLLFKKYKLYNEEYKIISDWIFNLKALILGKANIEILEFTTTIFDSTGISSNKKEMKREYELFYSQMKGLNILSNFYIKYYPMITKIKKRKIVTKIMRKILQIIKCI